MSEIGLAFRVNVLPEKSPQSLDFVCDNLISNGETCRLRRRPLPRYGSFHFYVKIVGAVEDNDCIYCGDCDTVEHTVLECTRWEEYMRGLERDVSVSVNAENIIGAMLENKTRFDGIFKFVNDMMEVKEREINE